MRQEGVCTIDVARCWLRGSSCELSRLISVVLLWAIQNSPERALSFPRFLRRDSADQRSKNYPSLAVFTPPLSSPSLTAHLLWLPQSLCGFLCCLFEETDSPYATAVVGSPCPVPAVLSKGPGLAAEATCPQGPLLVLLGSEGLDTGARHRDPQKTGAR